MYKKFSDIKHWGHKELFTIFLDSLHTIWYVNKEPHTNLIAIINKLSETAYPIQKLDRLLEELNETERELVGLEIKYLRRDQVCKDILLDTINSTHNFLFEEFDSTDNDDKKISQISHYYKLFCEYNNTTKTRDEFALYFDSLFYLFIGYYIFEKSHKKLIHRTYSEIAKILKTSSIQEAKDYEIFLISNIYDFHQLDGLTNKDILDKNETLFFRPKSGKKSGKIIENAAVNTLSVKGYNYKLQNNVKDLFCDISVYEPGGHVFDIECFSGRIDKNLKKKFLDYYFKKNKDKDIVLIFNGIWTIVFKENYVAFVLFDLPTLEEYNSDKIGLLYILQPDMTANGITYKKEYPNEIDNEKIQSLLIPKKKKSIDAGENLDIFFKNLFRDKTVVLNEKEETDATYSMIMHGTNTTCGIWVREIEILMDDLKKEKNIDQLKNKSETFLERLKKSIVNYSNKIERNIEDFKDDPSTQDSEKIDIDIDSLKDCKNKNCEKCFKCIQKEFSQYDREQITKWADKKRITIDEARRIIDFIKSAQFDIEILKNDFSSIEVKENFLIAIYNLIHNSFRHGYIDLPKRIAIKTYANYHEIGLKEAYKRLNENSYDDIIGQLRDDEIDEKQFFQNSEEIKLKLVIGKSKDDKIYFIYSQNGKYLIKKNYTAKDFNMNFWQFRRADSDKKIGKICGNYQTKRIIRSNGGEIWIVRPENFEEQFRMQKECLPYSGLTIMFYVK